RLLRPLPRRRRLRSPRRCLRPSPLLLSSPCRRLRSSRLLRPCKFRSPEPKRCHLPRHPWLPRRIGTKSPICSGERAPICLRAMSRQRVWFYAEQQNAITRRPHLLSAGLTIPPSCSVSASSASRPTPLGRESGTARQRNSAPPMLRSGSNSSFQPPPLSLLINPSPPALHHLH